jgi:hypothetical protein
MRRWLIFSGAILAISLARPASVQAEPLFTITPPVQDLTITGSAPPAVTAQIKNSSATAVTFKITTLDFGTLDQTGGVVFLDPGKSSSSYGLASFLQSPAPTITVAPGQTGQIKLDVVGADKLTPGGHYGAVMAQPVAGPSQAQVDVNAILTSLILLHKAGGEKYQLVLQQLGAPRLMSRLSSRLHPSFYNGGNLHVTPRGKVGLLDFRGKVMAKGIINEASGLLMPQHTRDYPVELASQHRLVWPGLYWYKASFHYDGSEQLQTVSQRVIYLPLWSLVGLLLIAAGMVATAVWLNRHFRKA